MERKEEDPHSRDDGVPRIQKLPGREPVPSTAAAEQRARWYLSPVAASSRAFLGVWVVTYTSLSLGSSSSSLLSTQLSACSCRSLLAFLLGRLLSEM